jgi:CheY-like chemotaxis protein
MFEDELISIIDNDTLARYGVVALVESLGYKAVSFSSAEHFLASDAIAETTCLITDLQMPGLSGLELQEALRSQGHRTPVILMTTYPNESRRNPAICWRSGWILEQTVRRYIADRMPGCRDQVAISKLTLTLAAWN